MVKVESILNLSKPDLVAKKLIKKRYWTTFRMSRICRMGGQWFIWKEGEYKEIDDEFMRAKIRNWLLENTLKKENRFGKLVRANCSKRVVDEIVDALIAKAIIKSEESGFFWLRPDQSYCKTDSVVSFSNGLFDVENMKLHDHTPNWFTRSVLPYSYDKHAICPVWKSWLFNICGKDADWVDCMQLWFGYNLSSDTSKQRFAHFFGLPRSGKGTTTRILTSFLGSWNCISPTLTQLGTNKHVLHGMVGKLAAIIPDAVMGRNVDSKVVMELLSSIIGEDPVDVERKYLTTMSSIKMKVRFTVTSNEPLKWPDPTNKLSSRALVFPFNHSYAGHEDPSVEQKLMLELPGIANWALEGLKRLRNGEKLREPESGKEKHQLFRDLDSPISVFCKECLEFKEGSDDYLDREHVQIVWDTWSRKEKRPTKGQTKTYVRSLVLNAFPRMVEKRKGPRGKQQAVYVGLRLTETGRGLLKEARKRVRGTDALRSSLNL